MGDVINRTACPQCHSEGRDTAQDNLIVYQDNGAKCFACGYVVFPPDTRRTIEPSNKKPLITGYKYRDLVDWKISKAVCQMANYGVTEDKGTTIHVANYMSEMNEVISQKCRTPDKKMFMLGDTKNMPLYLQWLWHPSDNKVVIVCEGEKDALTLLEVTRGKCPVVSVPLGAQDAPNAIEKHLNWLTQFKTVLLALDMDEAGQKATQDTISFFPHHQLKIVSWTEKDPHDVYQRHGAQGVVDCLKAAKPYRPPDIVTWGDVKNKVLEPPKAGLPWPWETLTSWTYGIRRGELITVMAAPGVGKTNFIAEVCVNLLLHHQQICGYMSFEQPPYETYLRMIGKILNLPLHIPNTYFPKEEVQKIGAQLDDKLYCYDRSGVVDIEEVKQKLAYYVKELKCRIVVVDNLSSVAAAFTGDERRGIDCAMLELNALARELDITIFLVAHVAKDNRTSDSLADAAKPLKLSDARGSASIGQHSTLALGLERSTDAVIPDARNYMTVRCLKDQSFNARGNTLKLYYNPTAGQLEEHNGPY